VAIYHLSIKIISRGKGKSAVASAAYRAGEKIKNEYDGQTHNYTKKKGIEHTEIMLPEHAPPEYTDRSVLWNEVEKIEKAKNSQLAREIEIALPVELSKEQNLILVREYVKKNFVDNGMCADICIHDTGKGNPHAHIMLTMRPFTDKKEWGSKARKEYVLNAKGERIKLKSGEFKSVKVSTVDWNEQTKAEEWRKAWADEVNAVLEQQNTAERIDHRSFKRQGKEELPTIHMGVAACQMEQKGIPTERGNINRAIKINNREIRQLKKQIYEIDKWLKSIPEDNEPTLIETIDSILQNRKYRTPEQKFSTFKKAANLANFIIDNDINDYEKMHGKVKGMKDRLYVVRQALKSKETRIKELNENIDKRNVYREYEPIVAEYDSIKSAKKRQQFYYEHDYKIIQFRSAEKHLKKHFKNGKLPLKKWKSEVEELTAEKNGLYQQYYKLKDDVKMFDDVRREVDEIMRAEPQKERQQTRKHEMEL